MFLEIPQFWDIRYFLGCSHVSQDSLGNHCRRGIRVSGYSREVPVHFPGIILILMPVAGGFLGFPTGSLISWYFLGIPHVPWDSGISLQEFPELQARLTVTVSRKVPSLHQFTLVPHVPGYPRLHQFTLFCRNMPLGRPSLHAFSTFLDSRIPGESSLSCFSGISGTFWGSHVETRKERE